MTRAIKVGIFVVGGIVLFCVGLFLIGTRAQLFNHHFDVYAQFKNVDTLEPGAKVRVAGMDAGQLAAIEIPKGPSSEFRMKLQVDEKFRAIVRTDSKATIETEGMVGNQFVNIAMGSAKSPECSGCTLPSEEPVSTGALMRQGNEIAQTLHSTIDDLHHRADTVMQNITSASGQADALLAATKPKVVQMTANADAIVAGIRHGQGAAGKILSDKKVASDVSQTIANARQTSQDFEQTSRKVDGMVATIQQKDLPTVHQTLANTQQATKQINQAMGTFLARGNHNEGTAEALRDAAHGAQQTTSNLASDTEAVKHNFFLRGFFHRRGFFNLETITPSKYATSDFVKKPRERVWVPAAGMFDGDQKLTGAGRAALDDSMSKIVPFLPNNPLVVEGYATSGPPDQQYLASRQRSIEVAQYLESRFHLDAKRVGAIPLRDHPPAHSGKDRWDGVCLVLVVSKNQ